MRQPRVAVDAMGGDLGAAVVAEGAALACRELGVEVSLAGPESVLRASLEALGVEGLPIQVLDAPDVVEMAEAAYRSIEQNKLIELPIEP